MKRIRHLYLLLATFQILVLNTNNAIAQDQSYSISGTVTDGETGLPIPGAIIYIQEYQKGTTTNADGQFTVQNLRPNPVHIQVSFLGYGSKVRTIRPGENTSPLEFTLEPSVTVTEEVVVSGGRTGSKDEVPIKIESIGVKSVRETGAPSMISALTQLPGVEQISFGNGIGKPVIRGLSFSRVLTVFQGNRFENHQWGADHGLGLNDLGVDRIEVIKGPASLIYGSGAVGGVVNIIDERNAPVGQVVGDFQTSFFANSLGTRNQIGFKGTSDSGFYYGIRAGMENHADYIDGDGRTIGNSRFNTHTFRANAGINKSWGTSKVVYSYHKQRLGIIEDDEMEETLATTRNDRNMQLPFQDVADHLISWQNVLFLGDSRLEFNLSHHVNLRQEIEDAFDEVDLWLIQNNTSYDLKYYRPLSEKVELVFGLQGFYLQNENHPDAEEILIPDGYMLDQSVFALTNTSLGNLNLQAGMRYDFRQTNGNANDQKFLEYGYNLPGNPESRELTTRFSGLSGSMGASWQAAPFFLLKANLASGFRAPDLAELFSNGEHPGTNRFEIGDTNFEREQNWEVDLSGNFTFENFSFELASFYNHINNYIFFSPTDEELPGTDLIIWRFDQQDATLYGGEVSLNIHPKNAEWFSTKSHFATVVGESRETGENLPLIPANRISNEINFTKKALGKLENPFMRVRLLSVFQQDMIAPDEETTPAYHLLSLGFGANYKVGNQRVEASIIANNLLNQTYFDHLSLLRPFMVNDMGRNVTVNLKIPFQIK